MAHGARPLRSVRRLQNLTTSLPKWYNIVRNQSGPSLISIYDEIGFYGVSAAPFLDELSQVPGDIDLHLHSPGGDIYEALAIYGGLLRAQKRGIVAITIDGLAASAASFIAMAASPGKLEISPHAEVMIHDGFTMGIGNAKDLRQLADDLDRESDNIAGIYADRTGKPAAYWREKMRAETWYTDQQAVDEGLADRIVGQEAPANTWDMSVFGRASVALNAAPMHEPHSGTHSHKGPGGQDEREHAHDGDASHEGVYDPDHDGDDDSTAEGDTDHDYVLPDGSPGPKAQWHAHFSPQNADKYKQADRDEMAKSGEAMPDGSYPIRDAEDLDNAIRAVGRGGADHDEIRRHIIKRAKALDLESRIPDDWGSDGSLQDLADPHLLAALFTDALEGVNVR